MVWCGVGWGGVGWGGVGWGGVGWGGVGCGCVCVGLWRGLLVRCAWHPSGPAKDPPSLPFTAHAFLSPYQ